MELNNYPNVLVIKSDGLFITGVAIYILLF